MSFYLIGFLLYYSLPISFVNYLYYSFPSPAPIPTQKECSYVINPKSFFNSPLGNPNKLEESLKKLEALPYHTQDRVLGYKDIGILRWAAYIIFEYLPKSLVFEKPRDPYSLLKNDQCLPIASDIPIIFSFWTWDFPSYSFILGNKKNLQYGENCQEPKNGNFIPYVGNDKLRLYLYSKEGFYFPGDTIKTPATLSIDMLNKKVLLFILHNGKLYKVFDQRTLREVINEGGSYRVYAYTYNYRLWRFYFGLRFFFCSPEFQAI